MWPSERKTLKLATYGSLLPECVRGANRLETVYETVTMSSSAFIWANSKRFPDVFSLYKNEMRMQDNTLSKSENVALDIWLVRWNDIFEKTKFKKMFYGILRLQAQCRALNVRHARVHSGYSEYDYLDKSAKLIFYPVNSLPPTRWEIMPLFHKRRASYGHMMLLLKYADAETQILFFDPNGKSSYADKYTGYLDRAMAHMGWIGSRRAFLNDVINQNTGIKQYIGEGDGLCVVLSLWVANIILLSPNITPQMLSDFVAYRTKQWGHVPMTNVQAKRNWSRFAEYVYEDLLLRLRQFEVFNPSAMLYDRRREPDEPYEPPLLQDSLYPLRFTQQECDLLKKELQLTGDDKGDLDKLKNYPISTFVDCDAPVPGVPAENVYSDAVEFATNNVPRFPRVGSVDTMHRERTELLRRGIFIDYLETQMHMMIHFINDLPLTHDAIMWAVSNSSREVLAQYVFVLKGETYSLEEAIVNTPEFFEENFHTPKYEQGAVAITTVKSGGILQLDGSSIKRIRKFESDIVFDEVVPPPLGFGVELGSYFVVRIQAYHLNVNRQSKTMSARDS